ncbi:hypothetical protein K469DRAFT_755762 [Zopfia rhizophila CBS 207.26]|uniref:Nucleoporin NUP37 n=1 Tax=Zopfia rhizophila CBS 207.26 TaxID=1314779 RepID=A0A6A6DBL7_9PEZI|nr:hypothetical protein K469DRAFT_755762 [Zopfia rhizophila CBS 207.26]
MKPIISTKGKSAQLRYELPHRVHDAKVYPVKAPNGSTVTLYGHEHGVRILWRGGRPIKQGLLPPKQPAKQPKVNGTSTNAIMIIDSDDEDPTAKSAPRPPEEAEFESEEEELDPDEPYPTFIQHLDLALHTEVLHIAVPQIPAISALRPADSVPAIFSKKIVFTVACVDYSIRVVTLPLSPPSAATKSRPSDTKSRWGEEVIKISIHAGHQSIPRGVTMTWTSKVEPTFQGEPEEEMDVDEEDTAATPRRRRARRRQSRSRSSRCGEAEGWDLLIASHSAELGGLLKIWRLAIAECSITAPFPIVAYQTLNLRTPASNVVFNAAQYPKRRHSQLLITDSSGVARIYDPFTSSRQRQGSRAVGGNSESGAYIATFRTTFESQKSNSVTSPILVHRKPIIDAAWASDGRSIVALLTDSEWGIWDVDRSGPKPPSDPSSFSLRGFVGSSEPSRSSSGTASPKTRNSRNTLAPMTPNTRRTREESLFHGTSASSSAPSRGGISIATLHSTSGGAPEDSVIIWYGTEAYRIPNLGQYWARTASGSGGSLYGPGLSKIQGLALRGEAITSIDQFDTTTREARMAISRDVLIASEHRFIITTHATLSLGRDPDAVFEKERTEDEETRRVDHALLARGELDLGGMDRLLEEMNGGAGAQHNSLLLGNPRKVLFASSTN